MDVEETTGLQNNPTELFEGDNGEGDNGEGEDGEGEDGEGEDGEGEDGEGEDVTFMNKTVTISDNGTMVIN
jgi:hypothetical protein